MTIAELRAARAAKVQQARAILAAAETEKRSLTLEQSQQFATLQSKITELEAAEQRQQFLDDAERRQVGTPIHGDRATLEQRVNLLNVLRVGMEGRTVTAAAAEDARRIGAPTQPPSTATSWSALALREAH